MENNSDTTNIKIKRIKPKIELKIINGVYTFANVYISEFEKPICAFGHYILARRRGLAPSVGAVRLTRGPRSQLLQVQPSEKLESVLAGVPVAVAGH